MAGPALALVVALLVAACSRPAAPAPDRPAPPAPDRPEAAAPALQPDVAAFEPFCPRPLTDPPRLVVERPCGTQRAVLTDGAYTAVLLGPSRHLGGDTAPAVVTTDWVRALPAPFSGTFEDATARWLDGALADVRPDLLALALQYVEGAPAIVERGLQIAGDADYGPLSDAGGRLEGADFNDYLGLPWRYPDGAMDRPKPDMLHSLDCSGYMRMIWGYRSGLPLAPGPVTSGRALARRAVQMEAAGLGVVIVPNGAAAPTQIGQLQAGDLVFFDADPTDGPAIDHVGMFLGRDEAGHLRFISSRKGANGPTLGDEHGASILDGPGLYAKAFRSARRL